MGDFEVTNVAESSDVPSYLKGYEELYRREPRAAALEWFKDAQFGLGMHYALCSLVTEGMGKDPDDPLTTYQFKLLRACLTPDDWLKVRDRFTAERFDADFITDLALEAGARYVWFTTKHYGGLYMWDTKATDFNSVNSPAGRDLVAELSEQCQKKGLGLCLYHPGDVMKRDPRELFKREGGILRELLTQYGPIANIWFDGIQQFYRNPGQYRVAETYRLIRSLQPQCLISFKTGATGDEDFAACEGLPCPPLPPRLTEAGRPIPCSELAPFPSKKWGEVAERAWKMNRGKRGELIEQMQTAPRQYFYIEGGKSLNADQVMLVMATAFAHNANLLLNTNPRFDGSIPEDQVATLREVGRRIRENGWPRPKLLDKKVWRSWSKNKGTPKVEGKTWKEHMERIAELVRAQKEMLKEKNYGPTGSPYS